MLHELGHALEISHPEIMSRTRRFLQARTVGQQPRRLSQDYPHLGYHDDEYYLPDLWFNDYCGKLYRGGATEILSMGLERLVREPIEFVREDPEYAGLILGIIEL
ncbi:MAG TPA: hypothetical protein DCZ72_11040 [Armatimonadetes bacterium]|nr:hypothetical protein [Armatimonadota bacterium]